MFFHLLAEALPAPISFKFLTGKILLMFDQSLGRPIFAITNVPYAGQPAVMYNLLFTDKMVIGIGIYDAQGKLRSMGKWEQKQTLISQEVLTNSFDLTAGRLGSTVLFSMDNNAIRTIKVYKNFSNTVFDGEFSTIDIFISLMSSNSLWISTQIQEKVKSLILKTSLASKLRDTALQN